ncbi:MAG: MgtC/SapB family protein [Clostridia bacterium]|nr:MgtC/SapB family protein [Clostridia bacterium]
MEAVKEFIFSYDLHLLFRMIVASICGFAIGFERKNRAKDAGIRTHCIVAVASAMMMIVSKYGFNDMIESIEFLNADVRLDPSRMAQGIVTGVGFLGSGLIFHQRGSTQGLTTAAGIWATSGIGMALGAGMYRIGIFTTIIMLVIQYFLHARMKFTKTHKTKLLRVFGVTEIGYEKKMIEQLAQKQISVSDVSIVKNADNEIDYTFHIEMADDRAEEELVREVEYPCSLKYVN